MVEYELKKICKLGAFMKNLMILAIGLLLISSSSKATVLKASTLDASRARTKFETAQECQEYRFTVDGIRYACQFCPVMDDGSYECKGRKVADVPTNSMYKSAISNL